jgi:xanthine dehydrogenase iron-sulfur cluster and FAD-binding subunit A
MYSTYHAPATLAEALALKAQQGEAARIVAGGTDLLIELDRGLRRTPEGLPPALIDLTYIPGLAEISVEEQWLHLGPLVTHNQCVVDDHIVDEAFALSQACWEVGAPQIRNRATVAGNLITASPANDSIVPLLALDAQVELTSAGRGSRSLPLDAFYTAFRQVDLAPDEILTRISIPRSHDRQESVFIKLGLRRAQAISVVNVAVVLRWAADGAITHAAISLGCVAPRVVRAPAAEAFLVGRQLDEAAIVQAAQLAVEAAAPIDDIRSSAAYRQAMVSTLVARALRRLQLGEVRANWLQQPVMLWGTSGGKWPVNHTSAALPRPAPDAGHAWVNGKSIPLPGGMTLLDSLRAAGYISVKEGCAEGECGACTVFLDDMAVMACLVPAERATGSSIVTVEGLGTPTALHPVQAALVASGGVQCGYCTPGFVMSGAKLLEERPQPARHEVAQAFTGNLCRCTGYRKIVDAVVNAGSSTT